MPSLKEYVTFTENYSIQDTVFKVRVKLNDRYGQVLR